MAGFNIFTKTGSKIHNVSIDETQPQNLSKEDMVKKYFSFIDSEKRIAVEEWRKNQTATSLREEFYLGVIERAKDNEKPFNIATIEPSAKDGELFYHENEVVAIDYTLEEWDQMAREFMPERNSRLATLEELFVFYALRNVMNLWTIDDVCYSTKGFGNYWDAPKAKRHIEHSGVRKAAGFFDGIGNTSKICRYDDFVFALTGGHFDKNGSEYPIGGFVKLSNDIKTRYRFSTGVVVCD